MPKRPDPTKPYSRYRGAAGRVGVVLPPEGCSLPVPKMPAGRKWSAAERALWRELWQSPQATQWDESAASPVALYVAHTVAVLAGDAYGWQGQEAGKLADRLGLTPAGLQALGWTVGEPDGAAVTPLSVAR